MKTPRDSREPSARRRLWGSVKAFPVFAIFVASYTLVHLVFEYNFWVTDGEAVFGKYAAVSEGNPLVIAREVYFAKATWMFVLVWLLVLRLPLRTAITYSFLLYSMELLIFFEPKPYLVLNIVLALGLLAELHVKPPRRDTSLPTEH